MSRLKTLFDALRQKKIKALIPFITAGDPQPDFTVTLMHAMVTAGASIIELGVPFSDPMADGPVIQAADERALLHHVSLLDVIEMVKQFRRDDVQTPVVLMGYLNPIEILGYQRFAELASAAGIDGVLIVDMPPEEAEEFTALMTQNSINTIFLISPTTSAKRIEKICQFASGYLYYVSLKGVTGANTLDVDSVARKLTEIRSITDLPVGVGFGIKDGETAQAVSRVADAVVVGSALVKKMAKYQNDQDLMNQKVSGILREMRSMMDAVSEN
ncbi:MAG: tryptophan synthase subunit alpha [Gammaproteobacteria bacterium]|nr:tryptophan synthase subunit alpha [Gammaproteobacteria bacterium]MBL6998233.1 tryptophan synthase subunit alpha [Gammaproteobacteria bacterium]